MARIKACFFDQDGVIIDTERDGHRVAFNRAFQEFDIPVEWDVETYRELLQVSGGKERMRHYLHTVGFGVDVPEDKEDDLIRRLHKRKTDIFIEMLEQGQLPLRPGVRRFMQEAADKGLVLGICTTSNQRAARAIADGILSDIDFAFVLAGDMVSNKKPDPEIYELALKRAGLGPQECFVVEDSSNGVVAARAVGLHVLATTNPYTEQEDLSQADIVVSCLGDPGGEKGLLRASDRDLDFDGVLHVDAVVDYFSD